MEQTWLIDGKSRQKATIAGPLLLTRSPPNKTRVLMNHGCDEARNHGFDETRNISEPWVSEIRTGQLKPPF